MGESIVYERVGEWIREIAPTPGLLPWLLGWANREAKREAFSWVVQR